MAETTIQVQGLLDRVAAGDLDARRELCAVAHHRVESMARRLMRVDFSVMEGRHDHASIVNRCWIKLDKALASESVQLRTAEDFFRFATHKLRQTFLDLVAELRDQDRRFRTMPVGSTSDGSRSSEFDPPVNVDPAASTIAEEVSEAIGRLPELERQLLERHLFLGVTQADLARQTGLHPRKVSRLIESALDKLAPWVGEIG